ncbi:AIPR family protein, partial [Holdemania filiformis]|uniref:AIPR family protein n=1 Tax=Holdemania filiformis TaxID=61171 RepID=UPI00267601AA
RQIIEIDFKEYCSEGIPCIEASSASTEQYSSYLGVIPGTVLADIYDKYGSKLLEGNVRSFLSTKVAVNKKIRGTILNNPQMFFAFNNGISATAMDVEIEDTNHGRFITFVRDFQIINGGQTTASISNARYKDKADLSSIFVQMKLTSIDETTPEESNELIRNISRSSNSQNKVSDADFFASHPFHRRMEQISRHLFAPASEGAQYETKWFYERARGQYLQEQMRMTPAKKKQFELQHPKSKVIKKTDLAKAQNTWRGFPQVVSKGAQTNFNAFAEYIDEQWNANDEQFNERYFQTTAALILLFQYLEKNIPKQPWYEGGYRANIIYYTLAQFRRLLHNQYLGQELDLMLIWNKQGVPEQVGSVLIILAELVLLRITDPSRKVANVTQWCKQNDCWEDVKKIHIDIPENIENCLITIEEQKAVQKSARKEQKVVNDIQVQTLVVNYPVEMWMRLSEFVVKNHMVTPTDVSALAIACKMPAKIPNTYQCKRLLALLRKASEEGFNIEV